MIEIFFVFVFFLFSNLLFFFFFFQAEDGIRDGRVTGVQTCALPICRLRARSTGLPHFPHVGGFASWSARSWSRTAARTWPSVRSLAGTWCCRKPMRRRWLA